MSQWEFLCLLRRTTEPEFAWLPVHIALCLQQWFACPCPLSLPCVSALLCICFSHYFHFSKAGKGGHNLQKQCDLCCSDSKWKRRQREQPACGTGDRPEQSVKGSLTVAAVAAPFWLLPVVSCHLRWPQLQRNRRQTPFGFKFPRKEDCVILLAQEGILSYSLFSFGPESFLCLLPCLSCRNSHRS